MTMLRRTRRQESSQITSIWTGEEGFGRFVLADELAASLLAEASIKQYASVSDNTMSFTNATAIEAGKPY